MLLLHDTRQNICFLSLVLVFKSITAMIWMALYICILMPLKLYKLGGQILISHHSHSESVGRACSSCCPVLSTAPSVLPLRFGCVVVHPWSRPAFCERTSQPYLLVVPRRPPLPGC